jgi:hypothetical protein
MGGERGVGHCPINLASKLSGKKKLKKYTMDLDGPFEDKRRRILFRGCASGGRRDGSAVSPFWGQYKLIGGKKLK